MLEVGIHLTWQWGGVILKPLNLQSIGAPSAVPSTDYQSPSYPPVDQQLQGIIPYIGFEFQISICEFSHRSQTKDTQRVSMRMHTIIETLDSQMINYAFETR